MPATKKATKKMAKKSRTKKASAKRSISKAAFRKRLAEQREEILSLYNHDLRAGQQSNQDGTEDIVDRANNAYNRELTFSLSDSERILLLQIEEAQERLESGGFGSCANCGTAINDKRLQAVPWTRHCIDCQELEEKGLLRE